MTNILAFGTGKGGVGKTTLAVNVADLAAARGKRTLLVDMDSQADTNLVLGFDTDDGGWAHLALLKGQEFNPVTEVRPGLDLLPAGEDTDTLSDVLTRAESKHGPEALANLRRVWVEAFAPYDLVVVDTPPARQSRTLTDAVMQAADFLAIPTRTDAKSIRSIRTLSTRYAALRKAGLARQLQIAGVVLFATGTAATAIRADTRASLEEVLGGHIHVFHAAIRATEKADRDSGLDRLTVREYAAAATADADRTYSSTAAALRSDYATLLDELFTIMEGKA